MKWRGLSFGQVLGVAGVAAIALVILSPIFARAQGIIARSDCQQHMGQVMKGFLLYCAANDDTVPPVDTYGFSQGWGNYSGVLGTDLPWSYVCQPYVGSLRVLVCPNDPYQDHHLNPTNTQVAGIRWEQQGHHIVPDCFHTNLGFNYAWLSHATGSSTSLSWTLVRLSDVASRANTIAFVDTAFTRDAAGGPRGGGTLYVDPPFPPSVDPLNKPLLGENYWQCYLTGKGNPSSASCSIDPSAFGKAYAWHPLGQAMTTAFLDMHVKAMSPAQLVRGWNYINDPSGHAVDWSTFLWDTYQ